MAQTRMSHSYRSRLFCRCSNRIALGWLLIPAIFIFLLPPSKRIEYHTVETNVINGYFPSGLALDRNQNLYVRDNHRVLKFDSTGRFLQQIPNPVPYLSSISIDSNQFLYLGNCSGVFKLFPNGSYFKIFDAKSSYGILDPDNNIYITDTTHKRIVKLAPDGTQLRTFTTHNPDLSDPLRITLDSDQNLYVVDHVGQGRSRIVKISPNGEQLQNFTAEYAYDVVVDSYGNTYVSEPDWNRVSKFDSEGTRVQVMTTSKPRLKYPLGLAIDTEDNLYVADGMKPRIFKFLTGAPRGIANHPWIKIVIVGIVIITYLIMPRASRSTKRSLQLSRNIKVSLENIETVSRQIEDILRQLEDISRQPEFAGPIQELFHDTWRLYSDLSLDKSLDETSDLLIYESLDQSHQFLGRNELWYPSGDRYKGMLQDGQPNGRGRMLYANGTCYEGSWYNGQRHGEGKMIYPSSHMYIGEFREDLSCGIGRIYFIDGMRYRGECSDCVPHGFGQSQDSMGSIYNGYFLNGEHEGLARIRYADGNMYQGQYQKNKRHGVGRLSFANGDIYEGEWKESIRSGNGRMHFSNGTIYQGEWVQDYPHGSGKVVYNSGNVYHGQWTRGYPQGLGRMVYNDEKTYDGQWLTLYAIPVLHGYGVMISITGEVYEGKWAFGLPYYHWIHLCFCVLSIATYFNLL